MVAVVSGCGGNGSAEFDFDAFREPPRSFRPWVRWWWPGNDVATDEIRREVGLLDEGFFGGAEIQALDAALDPDADPDELARRRSFDTPSYYENVAAALDEARARGLRVDLSLGSGWPTGGMHIAPEKSLKTLTWNEWPVTGPGHVSLTLDGPRLPEFYTLVEAAASLGEPLARWMPDGAELVAAVAGRVTGGQRTEAWFDLEDQVTLDPDSIVNLTDEVGPEGNLSWDVPEGEWRVIGFFSVPDGEFPSFNAQPEPGYVMEHFDTGEVERNLEWLAGERTGLSAYYGNSLRGLFVDSFELKVDRFWTGDFIGEFESRRGYDLVPKLPAMVLPGADNHLFDGLGLPVKAPFGFDGDDARLQHDYALTASELFLERFAATARDWAGQRGMILRMQGYGSNVDVLKAAGTADIPEAEQLFAGGSDLFLKTVSSGAHLYGRNVVSAETWVWASRDHRSTPTVMKAALDKLFAAGVNHVVYHGFSYHKEDGYGEAGWHPFSSPWSGEGTYSSNVAESNPFWGDMEAVNRYAARSQLALRSGRPEADLLVFYPWLGFPASFIRMDGHEEPLYMGRIDGTDDGVGNSAWLDLAAGLLGDADLGAKGDYLEGWWEASSGLLAKGWSWDFVGEDALRGASFEDGMIEVGGVEYRALVLFGASEMSPDLAELLADLASQGMPVVGSGPAPDRQAGWLDHVQGDARVLEAVRRMMEAPGVAWDEDGQSDLADLLAQAGVAAGIGVEPSSPAVRFARRRLAGTSQIIFFANAGREPLEVAITVSGGCESPAWLDPWTGDVELASGVDAFGVLDLRLAAFGSRLLGCGLHLPADVMPQDPSREVASSHAVGPWSLEVKSDDVEGGSFMAADHVPTDWRHVEGLEHSAGPGEYRVTVELGATIDGNVVLDLGWVEGVAEVRWNGQLAGKAIVPPFEIDVTGVAVSGPNEVEVVVTPPLLNRLVGKGLAGDPEYRQFVGRADQLVPAGLVGPVSVRMERSSNQVP